MESLTYLYKAKIPSSQVCLNNIYFVFPYVFTSLEAHVGRATAFGDPRPNLRPYNPFFIALLRVLLLVENHGQPTSH